MGLRPRPSRGFHSDCTRCSALSKLNMGSGQRTRGFEPGKRRDGKRRDGALIKVARGLEGTGRPLGGWPFVSRRAGIQALRGRKLLRGDAGESEKGERIVGCPPDFGVFNGANVPYCSHAILHSKRTGSIMRRRRNGPAGGQRGTQRERWGCAPAYRLRGRGRVGSRGRVRGSRGR